MANQSILALMQTALQGLGVQSFGQPASVVGNSNQDVMQTLALVTSTGDEIAREFQWQAMTKEYRFTTQYLTTTGTWTTSAATVTGIPSTAALAANTWMVQGTGIPQDTYIQSVDSSSQVTLTQTPTAAGTGASIVFAQTKYAMPSDYDRQIDRSHYDKSKHWEMLGPETSQEWQWLKSSYISTGPRVRYRPLGNYFQIWPLIAGNEYLGFEYVSKWWVLGTSDTVPTKKLFTADTDTCAFPDPLMVALIKLKYYEAKGFDTTALQKAYNSQLELAKAHDAGSLTLSMAPRKSALLIGQENVPDSGYGS